MSNQESDITTLMQKLRRLKPAKIVIEPTVQLELLVTGALAAAGLQVVVVNHRQVPDLPGPAAYGPRPTELMPRFWPASIRPWRLRSAH